MTRISRREFLGYGAAVAGTAAMKGSATMKLVVSVENPIACTICGSQSVVP